MCTAHHIGILGWQRAIEVGADFIETDISATKDGFLICIHDVVLDVTTDVLNHTEFKDRVRTYEVEGSNVTGIFTGKTSLESLFWRPHLSTNLVKDSK